MIKDVLQNPFKIKDLGTLEYLLGLEVARYQQGIYLCQHIYCLELLFDNENLNRKPVNTPYDPII